MKDRFDDEREGKCICVPTNVWKSQGIFKRQESPAVCWWLAGGGRSLLQQSLCWSRIPARRTAGSQVPPRIPGSCYLQISISVFYRESTGNYSQYVNLRSTLQVQILLYFNVNETGELENYFPEQGINRELISFVMLRWVLYLEDSRFLNRCFDGCRQSILKIRAQSIKYIVGREFVIGCARLFHYFQRLNKKYKTF